MNFKDKSIKEMRDKTLKDLEDYNISEYDLKDIEKKIKENFLNAKIKEYNVFEMNKHKLKGENYNSIRSNLMYDNIFNFDEIDKTIKAVFDEITKEDKIKEVTPNLNFEKIFKMSRYDYIRGFKDSNFKLSDSNKAVLSEDFTQKVINLKEVVLSCWNLEDTYSRYEKLKDIVDFFKYAYDIKIDLGDYSDIYNLTLKDIEELFNKNGEVKFRFFKSWYYVTLKDESKQKDLKLRLIENELKYLVRDD